MIVVVDNDVMEALASWNLLHELAGAFGVEHIDLRVVDTARFRYHLKDELKGRRKFGQAWDRIAAFLSSTALIKDADPEDTVAAVDVTNFDPGELILFSFVSRTPGAIILTGDKRALEALSKAPSLQPMRQRLAGRVVCLEEVLRRLFSSCGFETVRDAVVTSSTTHVTTRVVFGSGLLTTQESANAALSAYLVPLQQLVPDLLRPP